MPNVARAKLPATYEAARTSLEKCASIDECMEWTDKTAVLASYAKQSADESLFKMAVRIRARAFKRCGELPAGVWAARTERATGENNGGAPPPFLSVKRGKVRSVERPREAGRARRQRAEGEIRSARRVGKSTYRLAPGGQGRSNDEIGAALSVGRDVVSL
jgi:hypothetical protein